MINRLILLMGMALLFISGRAQQIPAGTKIFHGFEIYASTIFREGSLWKQWFAEWLMEGVSASEIYQDNDKWYMSYISHQKNGLHFFKINDLQWNQDGSISIDKK